MKKEILLGVDGGNTKTDFFLFTTEGECLAYLKTGTSSHERFENGYEETEKLLKERIDELCKKANINISDIDSGVFGLAGADTPGQHRKLYEITQRILPCKTMVCNDSILGIMAVAPECVGVCCINGTGSSVGGINEEGESRQVGGFGNLSSDFAGGMYAAGEVLRTVYSEKYREGEKTSLTKGVYQFFNASETVDLMELLDPETFVMTKELELFLNRLLFEEANKGDASAQKIINKMALDMAQSAAGCINKLKFTDKVTVVLAGSLWVKGGYPGMQNAFEEYVRAHAKAECDFVVLQEPPAMGAIFGAYKLLKQQAPSDSFRQRVCDEIKEVSQS